ncbi:hypothetical protein BDR26DRAFT_860208 [Obelidium mucronatum]|nr:hypothetical protein BDR26DRAFT_860208 [Obelidium mucronatum]
MGSAWLKDRDEPQELNFFYVASQLNQKPSEAPTTTTSTTTTTTTTTTIPGSWRNFYTTINLLRILQKITKRKTHRIMALVQWKASAVLKRIIKVPNPALQLYALKLLKSQIPFMGKKWRSSNMKVITLIYMQLRPQLCEEYLSGDSDVNGDEALAQEQYLRSLIACYHHRVYPEIYPPPQPQPQQPQQQQQQQSSASIDPISGTVTNSSSNLLSNSSNSNNPIDPNDDLETMLMQPITTQEEGRGYNSEEEEEEEDARVICIVPEFNTTPLKTKNRYVVESGLHGDGVDDYFMRTYEAWLAEEVFGGGSG